MNSRSLLPVVAAVSTALILAGCTSVPEPTPTVTVTVTATQEAQLQGVVDLLNKFTDPLEMPDVVGLPLDEARQILRDEGAVLIDRQDATGQGRTVLLGKNWLVCEQQPEAGQETSKVGSVVLFVVRKDETCPATIG
jgi:beta-lactam-binding protein with PASTA domain